MVTYIIDFAANARREMFSATVRTKDLADSATAFDDGKEQQLVQLMPHLQGWFEKLGTEHKIEVNGVLHDTFAKARSPLMQQAHEALNGARTRARSRLPKVTKPRPTE